MGTGFIPFAFLSAEPVGSRVTCNPPPVGTDEDWLVLVAAATSLGNLDYDVRSEGWRLGGSLDADENVPIPDDDRFWSYTKGEKNLIITRSPVFYKRFMAASSVAKRLNLLDKADRIALFQAVLYANGGA